MTLTFAAIPHVRPPHDQDIHTQALTQAHVCETSVIINTTSTVLNFLSYPKMLAMTQETDLITH